MSQKQQVQLLLQQRQSVLDSLTKKLARVVMARKSKEQEHPLPVRTNIYVGSYSSANNRLFIQKQNITHIITCLGQLPASDNQGVQYLRLSLQDSTSQDIISHLDKVHQFIEDAVKNNQGVLVHCFKGISRSPALLMGYLIRKEAITAQEALADIRKVHPSANPNKGFMSQLSSYGQRVKLELLTQKYPQISLAGQTVGPPQLDSENLLEIEDIPGVKGNSQSEQNHQTLNIQLQQPQQQQRSETLVESLEISGKQIQMTENPQEKLSLAAQEVNVEGQATNGADQSHQQSPFQHQEDIKTENTYSKSLSEDFKPSVTVEQQVLVREQEVRIPDKPVETTEVAQTHQKDNSDQNQTTQLQKQPKEIIFIQQKELSEGALAEVAEQKKKKKKNNKKNKNR